MAKIWNREALLEEKVKNEFTMPLNAFRGSKEQNLSTVNVDRIDNDDIVKVSKNWKGTKGYLNLKKEINELITKCSNTAQPPSQAVLEEFFAKVKIDITKQTMMMADYTSLIATEIVREDFPEHVGLDWFMDFVGEFMEINLTGEAVPLIEQATAKKDSVTMEALGLGFAQTLKNVLYNSFYDVAKVNKAVSKAYIDKRNAVTVAAIANATYDASQKVPASTTSDVTADVLMYETLDVAEDKLRTLKDLRTDEEITVPKIALLVNSHDTKRITRVIDGQLNAFGKTPARNLPALNIDSIIEYDKGMTHGLKAGKKTISFPGVVKGKAYMFVPKEYFWVLTKRGLTNETSQGSALTLAQLEKAWYYIQTTYDTIFFGSSKTGTSLGAGYGAVVEITLP